MNSTPTSWPNVSVSEVCEFKYGRSLPNAQRSGGPVAVFGSNGIVGHHDEALTAGPAIVVGRKGSFGQVSYSGYPCWPIDTTYYIDTTCTAADLRWLSYQLASLELTRLNRAAAIPGLNREDAYRLRILLPPLPEQRRLARVLDQADALRAKRREALAQLDELTQSIFLNMFGHPVSNPYGIPLTRLGDVGRLERGVSKHRPRNAPELLGGPYPLVQTGEIANCDGYIRSYTGSYSKHGLQQSRIWPAGTLCITIAANIAMTGILTFDACFPDSVVGFTAEDSTTTEFVRSWLSFLQSSLERNAPKSAQRNINLATLRSLEVPLPSVELRQKFAQRVDRVEQIKVFHRAHLAELDALFASLQYRAFRGEL